jgi:hypothetical protein
MQKLQSLGLKVTAQNHHAGDIATRLIQADHVTELYRIVPESSDDWNCFGRGDGGNMSTACRNQHRGLASNQIGGEFRQSLDVPIRPSIFDSNVLVLNKPVLSQTILEGGDEVLIGGG